MAIAPTFEKYLATKHVVYDVVAHEPTKSSMRSAEACRVSGDRVAKAVVLRDEYGYVLAILPASHHIRLQDLRMQLGLDVDLAAQERSRRTLGVSYAEILKEHEQVILRFRSAYGT